MVDFIDFKNGNRINSLTFITDSIATIPPGTINKPFRCTFPDYPWLGFYTSPVTGGRLRIGVTYKRYMPFWSATYSLSFGPFRWDTHLIPPNWVIEEYLR
jgi:hypothetical protein